MGLLLERARQIWARRGGPVVRGFDPEDQTISEFEGLNLETAPGGHREHGRGAVIVRRYVVWLAEVTLALAAAAAIGVGVLWWRLSQGPIELNSLRDSIEMALSDARSGRPVTIEQVELAWSEEAGTVLLRAVDVAFQDAEGRELTRAEQAQIELGVLPLLIGRISVVEANFVGAELSVLRKPDGETHLILGPPSASADVIIPPPPPGESLRERVSRILDGMKAAFRPVGPGGQLRALSVTRARATVLDEQSGAEWTAQDASFTLGRVGDRLDLSVQASLEGAEGLAPATLRIATDTDLQAAIVEFETHDVRPRALFSPAMLGPFAGLDAPLDAIVSVGLNRQTGISRLEGEATLGRGVADMAGGRFAIDGGRLRGRYDIEADELVIDQIRLAGDRTRVNGEIRVREASSVLRAAPGEAAPFSVDIPSLVLNAPAVFSQPISLSEVSASGAIAVGDREVRFDSIHAKVGEGVADLSGRYYWAPAGAEGTSYPGIALQGAVSGSVSPQEVMALWPIGLGEGARSYLTDAFTAGRIHDATVNLDIRPADIASETLRNESVDLRFAFDDGAMRFIPTMSPLTNARGTARLQGNRFDATVEQGLINGLRVTQGGVEIPRLKPKGARATIRARAEGGARQMVELLMQEPIALGDRLPVDPASVQGAGSARLTISRPMLSDVPFEELHFQVDGRLENVSARMLERPISLSHAHIDVSGDQRAIRLSGPVRIGESNVTAQWTELINAGTRPSSRFRFSGDFDAADLRSLGYSVAGYARGKIGLVVDAQGRGFDIETAQVQLNLRDAAVEGPWAFWTKRAGAPATARFSVTRQRDDSLRFSDIEARGAGLTAQGEMRVSEAGDILSINLPRLAVEGRSDSSLALTRAADGAMEVNVRGAMFNAEPFMGGAEMGPPPAPMTPGASGAQNAAAPPPIPPVRATVRVDRLRMRGGAMLQGGNVNVSMRNNAVVRLSVTGQTAEAKAFNLSLGPTATNTRSRLRFSSEDAGFAVRALTGAENVVGGTASAEGDWRPGPPSRARFTLEMRDFEIVRLPAMARLLSSAGSLTGLVETLNGEGISYNSLSAPIVYTDERITIGESRASGPSLGLTASGAYDLENDDLNIDGTLVPSYGLNSMLGAVPLIGDLFVGRRGEGVIGINYSINGPIEEPRVGVNPLSAITPGILRRIFDPFRSRAEDETESAPQGDGGEEVAAPEAAPASP